jgi:hypothetical protein
VAERPVRVLRAKDWSLALVSPDRVLDAKNGALQGVIDATQDVGKEVLRHADDLLGLGVEGVGYVIVTPRPIADDSTREVVFFEDGSSGYRSVTLRGSALPAKPDERVAVIDGNINTTRVLVFTALHRTLPEELVKVLRDPTRGAGATDRLCVKAAKEAKVVVEKRHRWRHAKLPGRSTCMVRVPEAEANVLLTGSGHGGVFWSAPSFKEGGETDRIVWLDTDATLEDALCLAALPDAKGVAPAKARFGIRHGADLQALTAIKEAAAGLLAPEKRSEGDLYFVSGGQNEHASDMLESLARSGWVGNSRKSYAKGGRTCLVVAAAAPPPAAVVKRFGRDPLFIRPIARGDIPTTSKAKVWSGKVPNTSLPKTRTDQPEADMEEGANMEEDHLHVWGETDRNKEAAKCVTCGGDRQKGTMMRPCACGARICGSCLATAKKNSQ